MAIESWMRGQPRRLLLATDLSARCDRAFDQRAMRAQMKAADRSGAAYAVIVGEQEQADGVATVRPLRAEFGAEQVSVPRADLVAHLRSALAAPSAAGAPTPTPDVGGDRVAGATDRPPASSEDHPEEHS